MGGTSDEIFEYQSPRVLHSLSSKAEDVLDLMFGRWYPRSSLLNPSQWLFASSPLLGFGTKLYGKRALGLSSLRQRTAGSIKVNTSFSFFIHCPFFVSSHPFAPSFIFNISNIYILSFFAKLLISERNISWQTKLQNVDTISTLLCTIANTPNTLLILLHLMLNRLSQSDWQ